MAARTFNGESYQLEPAVIHLWARGTGAAAANLTSVKGKGIASITRTDVGAHTITLNDKYKGVLMLTAQIIDVTAPDDWEVVMTTDLTNSKTIGIQIFKGGAATDLTTDEKILLKLDMVDTTTVPTSY